MPLPQSASQVNKLGDRLRKQDPPAPADVEALHEVVAAHAGVLATVQEQLHAALPHVVTPRLKTTDTIVEKLRRERTRLATIQDIAGCRLSPVDGLDAQDTVTERIVDLFPGSRVSDRRQQPSAGYRAVHVIIELEGLHVEVQVRTVRQDQWAQIVERLADKWGRAIRYGGSPEAPDLVVLGADAKPPRFTRQDVLIQVLGLSTRIAAVERVEQMVARYEERQGWLKDAAIDDSDQSDSDVYSDFLDLKRQLAEVTTELEESLRVFSNFADLI